MHLSEVASLSHGDRVTRRAAAARELFARASVPANWRSSARNMPLFPSARPTVIICEDEILVRMLAVDLLDAAGFKTFEAGDAAEAAALLQARPTRTSS